MTKSAFGSRANSSNSRTGSSRSEARGGGGGGGGGGGSGGGGGGGGGLSVWEMAVAEGKKKRSGLVSDGDKAPREATVLLVGTRGSGKTTLLQRFLDREETARQTLALEYTYGRKTGRTLEEVGKAAAVIPEMKETLEAAAKKRLETGGNSVESEVTPFMVPLVIIGGKYDLFQELDPEEKKVICRALRFVAHTHGASLQFFSARDPGLVKKAKEVLSHLAFGTAESRSLAQDYNKPLLIPAGSDSLTTINLNEALNLDTWSHKFTAKYPQEGQEGSTALPEDPARDPTYAEADVDNLRTQKDEELERIRREVGRNSSRWADLDLN
ncbi:cytoplasmic dynein 2 light intermediate chain 1-like isoform X2 [Scylla paramamosain]|uniref:cytoplasmic dynein 2 light intermediate chain 1-like isoform X2 n=1 Tax=Scylla paramamosain TaxID=85552 RepID=UPI003083BC7B